MTDKNISDATTNINEQTVTQPYGAGRCWFQLTGNKRSTRFCETTAGVAMFWVTRPASQSKLRSAISVKMSVCELHLKSLKRSGYEVTKVAVP